LEGLPFRGYIEYYLSEDPFVSTAVIYQRLRQRGFSGSPCRIQDFLRERHTHAGVQTQLIKYPLRLESASQEACQEIGYLYVLKLLQGQVSKIDLQKRFAGKLPAADIHTLYDVILHKPLTLNLSEFVDGCSWPIKTGLHCSETRRFPRYGLENDAA